jgi:glutaredoxin
MNYKSAMRYMDIHSYNTLYKYIKFGLPVIVINGIKRIDQADADKFMQAHKI